MAKARLDVLNPEQLGDWLSALNSVSTQDIYFMPDYLRMVSANGDGIPKLAWLTCDHGDVVYPFLVRPINIEGIDTGFCDIASPYGYSGPIVKSINEDDTHDLASEFVQQFHSYCASTGIVAEFIRFHPLLRNANTFSGLIPVEYVRDTVYIDLRESSDKIWTDRLEGRTRNAIRKSEKSGVCVRYSHAECIPCFMDLYSETMQRLEADTYYYFTESYFKHLGELVDKSGILIEAVYESKVIASIVLLKGDKFSHYHLSASDPQFRRLQANSLLLWEAIKWSQNQGLSLMHLGGGYSSSYDSLFKFKAGFSPYTGEYHVGKVIHDGKKYAEMVTQALGRNKKEDIESTGFFPAYRLSVEEDELKNV